MAGLLDQMWADPSGQAITALGAGLLGVRRGNEGRAINGALMAYNEAQQSERRNKLTDAQLQFQAMQMQQMQQQLADQNAMRELFKDPSNYTTPAAPAVPWGTGMTGSIDQQDINPGMPAQPAKIDQQRMIQTMLRSGNPALVQKAMELSQKDETPISVKEGEVLLDRNTRQPIYKNPKAVNPPATPAAIQEYLFAVQQGYKGTFDQWSTSQKRAGASSVVVQDNSFDKAFGGGAVSEIKDSKLAAVGSAKSIGTLKQINDALNTGQVATGPGANIEVVLRQVGQKLNVGGKSNEEVLNNTRQLIQGMAKLGLDGATTMKGQGQVSNYERELVQKASSGDIDSMTVPEIRTLVRVLAKVHSAQIVSHQTLMKNLGPAAAKYAPFYQVDAQPWEPPAVVEPATPGAIPGVTYIGPAK